jgi:hypothetical protein
VLHVFHKLVVCLQNDTHVVLLKFNDHSSLVMAKTVLFLQAITL